MKKKIGYFIGVLALCSVALISYLSINKKHEPTILSGNDVKETAQQPVQTDQTGVEPAEEEAIIDDAELDATEEELAKAYSDLASKCEEGTWIDIESVEGTKATFSGKFSVDVPFEENEDGAVAEGREIYFLNGDKEVASIKDDVMGFFEGRQVEISGVDQAGKIKPEKIRCTGKETDKSLISFRQEVMNHVSANLNSLAPQKGDWEVYDIAWPSDDHIYVDFAAMESESEDSENVDENIYSLLFKVARENNQVKLEQVAFLKMADEEDDEDWNVLSGTDKFQDIEDMDYYEFDDVLKKWIK